MDDLTRRWGLEIGFYGNPQQLDDFVGWLYDNSPWITDGPGTFGIEGIDAGSNAEESTRMECDSVSDAMAAVNRLSEQLDLAINRLDRCREESSGFKQGSVVEVLVGDEWIPHRMSRHARWVGIYVSSSRRDGGWSKLEKWVDESLVRNVEVTTDVDQVEETPGVG